MHISQTPLVSEDARGGVGKRGGWKTSRKTVRFPPPSSRVSALPSCAKIHDALLEGSKKKGERVLWYVFLPPYVLPPPQIPWSHKPMSLNGRLGNSEIGGCKEIRQPFAHPLPTPRQPFANPSPTFRQPCANLFCQPSPTPLSMDPRHPFRDTGKRFLGYHGSIGGNLFPFDEPLLHQKP